jgi:hypothetical protein
LDASQVQIAGRCPLLLYKSDNGFSPDFYCFRANFQLVFYCLDSFLKSFPIKTKNSDSC